MLVFSLKKVDDLRAREQEGEEKRTTNSAARYFILEIETLVSTPDFMVCQNMHYRGFVSLIFQTNNLIWQKELLR